LAVEKVSKHQHRNSTLSWKFGTTDRHEMKKDKELYERRKVATERKYQQYHSDTED
jgi:hypothetical protein